MKKYSSDQVALRVSTQQAYEFLSDFRHFQKVLPSEISGWQADQDSCSFDAPMVGRLSFVYGTKTPFSLLSVVPSGKLPISISIECHLDAKDEAHYGQVVVVAEIGGMQEMLFGRILQNIAGMMASKLSELSEDDLVI